MELAAAVLFFFIVAIILMVLSVPLLIISRLARMLKKSYAKLFTARTHKA
jgi:hypothetical protein